MDHIYSPWRFRYLETPRAAAECVLCNALRGDEDEANLVVHRGTAAAVMLNLYPYTSGHAMIVPYAHAATLGECGASVRAELMEMAARLEAALEAEYHPDGINVGLNLGEAAGAGIAGHLHLHVVPRWRGDASFITVVGETRVLPEELGRTYARLRARLSAG